MKVLLIIVGILAVALVGGSIYKGRSTALAYESVTPIRETPLSPAEAQTELDYVMTLCQKMDLLRKYDLLTGNFCAGEGWYKTKASMKKYLLAKISLLKKQITGYTELEVHDVYNDQKLAEVTAFSQTIEIYE